MGRKANSASSVDRDLRWRLNLVITGNCTVHKERSKFCINVQKVCSDIKIKENNYCFKNCTLNSTIVFDLYNFFFFSLVNWTEFSLNFMYFTIELI